MKSSPDPKPSLHDVSRQLPTNEEFKAIIDGIDDMEARAAALILSSFVDNMLEFAIRCNFVPLSKQKFARLFRNPTAPLSSFSAKIMMGHALGIYGDGFKSQLDRFRSVRNVFAHAIRIIDFDEPTVSDECRKLDPRLLVNGVYQPDQDTPRERFTMVGILASKHLIAYVKLWRQEIASGQLAVRLPLNDKSGEPHPPEAQNQS